MVNILDLISEQKSKQRYLTNKSDARDYFVRQKQSLDTISSTQGFKEIKEYRARELITCNERLGTMKSEDVKGVQAERNLAMRFLDFLDNIKVAEISPMDEPF